MKVANEKILIKLNEEKLKEEVANSSAENIDYTEEINNLNKLLNESLVWKQSIKNQSGIITLQ